MNITLDMYQTIAVAVIVLMAGAFLKKRISFLQKFCIPAPVIGGLLFAILTLVLYMTGVAVIDFDDTLKGSLHGVFLYLSRISGESKGAEKRRQIPYRIFVSCNYAHCNAEFLCNRTCKFDRT